MFGIPCIGLKQFNDPLDPNTKTFKRQSLDKIDRTLSGPDDRFKSNLRRYFSQVSFSDNALDRSLTWTRILDLTTDESITTTVCLSLICFYNLVCLDVCTFTAYHVCLDVSTFTDKPRVSRCQYLY